MRWGPHWRLSCTSSSAYSNFSKALKESQRSANRRCVMLTWPCRRSSSPSALWTTCLICVTWRMASFSSSLKLLTQQRYSSLYAKYSVPRPWPKVSKFNGSMSKKWQFQGPLNLKLQALEREKKLWAMTIVLRAFWVTCPGLWVTKGVFSKFWSTLSKMRLNLQTMDKSVSMCSMRLDHRACMWV